MFNLGMPELILILVIALVVLGPAKLPEMGKALGKSILEFRNATSPSFQDEYKKLGEKEAGEEQAVKK